MNRVDWFLYKRSLYSSLLEQFDFLGKDSIRYFNTVEVDEQVFKAIKDFKKGNTPTVLALESNCTPSSFDMDFQLLV